MKNYAITSGKFTEKKNFTGYTALGERLHIHANQMASLGWKNGDADFKPFYAIGEVKKIGQLDADNKPVMKDGQPLLVDRLTANSVFATKAELINARVEVRTLDLEIEGAVVKEAKSLGLTAESIAELEKASV